MMQIGEILLSKESAQEALQCLVRLGSIGNIPYQIAQGSIKREELHGTSALELKLQFAITNSSPAVTSIAVSSKRLKDSEEISLTYRILQDIYEAMKERHGEVITPLGVVGPSKSIELVYSGPVRNTDGNKHPELISIGLGSIYLN